MKEDNKDEIRKARAFDWFFEIIIVGLFLAFGVSMVRLFLATIGLT